MQGRWKQETKVTEGTGHDKFHVQTNIWIQYCFAFFFSLSYPWLTEASWVSGLRCLYCQQCKLVGVRILSYKWSWYPVCLLAIHNSNAAVWKQHLNLNIIMMNGGCTNPVEAFLWHYDILRLLCHFYNENPQITNLNLILFFTEQI